MKLITPEQRIAEGKRLRKMIIEEKTSIDSVMESEYWSWTQEYWLGMLKSVSVILDELLKSLPNIERVSGKDRTEPESLKKPLSK